MSCFCIFLHILENYIKKDLDGVNIKQCINLFLNVVILKIEFFLFPDYEETC